MRRWDSTSRRVARRVRRIPSVLIGPWPGVVIVGKERLVASHIALPGATSWPRAKTARENVKPGRGDERKMTAAARDVCRTRRKLVTSCQPGRYSKQPERNHLMILLRGGKKKLPRLTTTPPTPLTGPHIIYSSYSNVTLWPWSVRGELLRYCPGLFFFAYSHDQLWYFFLLLNYSCSGNVDMLCKTNDSLAQDCVNLHLAKILQFLESFLTGTIKKTSQTDVFGRDIQSAV